jgi:hypothetical protein
MALLKIYVLRPESENTPYPDTGRFAHPVSENYLRSLAETADSLTLDTECAKHPISDALPT